MVADFRQNCQGINEDLQHPSGAGTFYPPFALKGGAYTMKRRQGLSSGTEIKYSVLFSCSSPSPGPGSILLNRPWAQSAPGRDFSPSHWPCFRGWEHSAAWTQASAHQPAQPWGLEPEANRKFRCCSWKSVFFGGCSQSAGRKQGGLNLHFPNFISQS